MVETNPIHPDVRKFARETNAETIDTMGNGAGRIRYGENPDFGGILHIGEHSDAPNGFQANMMSVGADVVIDLFPPL